jgi:hypothetical protein
MRTYLAKGMTLAEVSRQNEEMAGFACGMQYDFPRWSESPQPPEVARFLEECRRLTEQYPRQLPAWGSTWKAVLEKYGPAQPAATTPQEETK